MILRLASGSTTPASFSRNRSPGAAVHDAHVEAVAEQRRHLVALAGAQQPVVDEHADETIADRLVQQRRGHRGVDPAGKAAQNPGLADALAQGGHRAVAKGRHRPVAAATGDAVGEVAQQRRAVGRVRHLGMKLHAVEAAALVGDRGERRPRR